MFKYKLSIVTLVALVLALVGTGMGLLAVQSFANQAAAIPVASAPDKPEAQEPDGAKAAQSRAGSRAAADPDPQGSKPAGADQHGDPLPSGARARMGTLRYRHGGDISSSAISPDSKVLVTAGENNRIRLHELATGRVIGELPAKGIPSWRAGGSLLAFSSQTQTLAVGGTAGVIELWDMGTLKKLRELQGHQGKVYSVAFSPDGQTLVSGGGDKTIRVWTVATGQESQRFPAHSNGVIQVVFAPDGKRLASLGYDDTEGTKGLEQEHKIKLWDAATGKELRQFLGHDGPVRAIAFSPDGKSLASAGGGDGDGTMRLWEVATGRAQLQIPKIRCSSHSIAFSPDGKTLATGDFRGSLSLWDVAAGKLLRQVVTHQGQIRQVAFSPDGKFLVSVDACTIHLWDVGQGKAFNPIQEHKGAVRALAFSPDGKTLATSDSSYWGTIHLWDAANGKELHRLDVDNRPPTDNTSPAFAQLNFSPDGKTLASAYRLTWPPPAEHKIQLWDVATAKEVKQYTCEGTYVAFSPDGKTLVLGAKDDLRLWDLATGQERQRFQLSKAITNPLVVSPDGKILAATAVGREGANRTVNSWDLDTGKEIRQLADHPGRLSFGPPPISHPAVAVVAFSANGRMLVSGGGDNETKFFLLREVTTGKELHHIPLKHPADVWAVAFSPDGKMLAHPDGGKTIALWDVATWKKVGDLPGHSDTIYSLAFSPDGKTLASGSHDTTVLLWDLTRFPVK